MLMLLVVMRTVQELILLFKWKDCGGYSMGKHFPEKSLEAVKEKSFADIRDEK
jgi:hypothetical protein